MTSSITIKIANTTATRTIGAGITDQAVANALTRYARNVGVPVTGVALDDLLAIADHIIGEIKERSKAQDASDLRSTNEAAIQTTIDANNAL